MRMRVDACVVWRRKYACGAKGTCALACLRAGLTPCPPPPAPGPLPTSVPELQPDALCVLVLLAHPYADTRPGGTHNPGGVPWPQLPQAARCRRPPAVHTHDSPAVPRPGCLCRSQCSGSICRTGRRCRCCRRRRAAPAANACD
eukprot:360045-Chlamydomonas_euryale.AAC.11